MRLAERSVSFSVLPPKSPQHGRSTGADVYEFKILD